MWNDKEFNELKKIAYNESSPATLHSIADMESALANLLNTKVDVLNNNSDNWTPEQILTYMEHLESTLKKVILKEIIMLLLLDEKDHKPKKCHCPKGTKCDCNRECDCHKGEKCECTRECHCHKGKECECKREYHSHKDYECDCHRKCHRLEDHKCDCKCHYDSSYSYKGNFIHSKNTCSCFSW